jgi:hypothetical protein
VRSSPPGQQATLDAHPLPWIERRWQSALRVCDHLGVPRRDPALAERGPRGRTRVVEVAGQAHLPMRIVTVLVRERGRPRGRRGRAGRARRTPAIGQCQQSQLHGPDTRLDAVPGLQRLPQLLVGQLVERARPGVGEEVVEHPLRHAGALDDGRRQHQSRHVVEETGHATSLSNTCSNHKASSAPRLLAGRKFSIVCEEALPTS